jgi:hypothetical protein
MGLSARRSRRLGRACRYQRDDRNDGLMTTRRRPRASAADAALARFAEAETILAEDSPSIRASTRLRASGTATSASPTERAAWARRPHRRRSRTRRAAQTLGWVGRAARRAGCRARLPHRPLRLYADSSTANPVVGPAVDAPRSSVAPALTTTSPRPPHPRSTRHTLGTLPPPARTSTVRGLLRARGLHPRGHPVPRLPLPRPPASARAGAIIRSAAAGGSGAGGRRGGLMTWSC